MWFADFCVKTETELRQTDFLVFAAENQKKNVRNFEQVSRIFGVCQTT